MPIPIETFSNVSGGNTFYKALCHPLAAEKAVTLMDELAEAGPVAVYDPLDQAESFAALYGLDRLDISAVFVQRIEDLGKTRLGQSTQPVSEIGGTSAATVFLPAFDADRLTSQIRHLVAPDKRVVSLDSIRLPDDMLTNRRRYLDPLNFATNFAFFRDADGHHTTLRSVNYWFGHGAKETALWLRLHDHAGNVLADWRKTLPSASASFAIDSREVRARCGLSDFTGSLFLHAIGAAGHDMIKYALDTYGDEATVLSCTHDANAWPADLYGGLPAPALKERVILWIQNSHPVTIPSGDIGLNLMGSDEVQWLEEEIPPFGTYPLDVSTLLPKAAWPDQIEVRAGRHFVRPRYEVTETGGRSRIAHVNVERTDLKPDPKIAEIGNLMGKGYILPAPLLPPEHWRNFALPTPMSTCQNELPLRILVIDASGREIARKGLGRVARDACGVVDLDALIEEEGAELPCGYGHVELTYDFSGGGEADGWLHGLFRYQNRASGHIAETSFGAHIYNLPITYRNEPQSYISSPPGLSTRLFLRIGPQPLDTMVHLIYPASAGWHASSSTTLHLFDAAGREVAQESIEIPCSGSRLMRYSELFDAKTRERAGEGAHIIVRDSTCRLFGYHGLLNGDGAFSFDHMFGF